jgi:endoglucanase
MRRLPHIFFFCFFITSYSFAQFKITDAEYFDADGKSVLVFHNDYPEGHQGGIEIILHDQRIATNGDLRLEPTPGQWDSLPEIGERKVDEKENKISINGTYTDLDIHYTVAVKAEKEAIRITVDLDKPIPFQWAGKVGFNLELFPPAYFGKSWRMDGESGFFQRQANGSIKLSSNDICTPLPIAAGMDFFAAAEDPLCSLHIKSEKSEIELYDGRITDNNGWFVLHSLIPGGVSQNAVEWIISPNVKKDWRMAPRLLYSQVGYHPEQEKKVVLELDRQQKKRRKATLVRLLDDGSTKTEFSATTKFWGQFLRYNYAIFDFSRVTEPGFYRVEYEDQATQPFQISNDILKQNVWQPTLETFLPVQMCHMEVRDRYRIWHGLCHMDDALQAPTEHAHFDGYKQGEKTETPFQVQSHINGLNVGGWHDAGDYDLASGSQAATVYALVMAHETFDVSTDQTTVITAENFVTLHKPDGKIDILQQIEHGVEFLLSGYRTCGHAIIGVISPTTEQYVHLGDAMSKTDNQIYDASEDVLPTPEHRRGKMDDRWAFTNRDSGLELQVAATLAAAHRVLEEANPDLAKECLKTAEQIWTYESEHDPVRHKAAYVPANIDVQRVLAAVELFTSTNNFKYANAIVGMSKEIRTNIAQTGWAVAQIFTQLNNETFDHDFFRAIRDYNESIKEDIEKNPFGIPFRPHIWGIGWNLQHYAMRQYYLHRAFPELFDRELVLRVVNWVLGCHPSSNVSFVSGIGTNSLTAAYGTNRADYSYIPGGVASGVALIKPDFPEFKSDWPYLWQQSEYVISGAATYIFCILAADKLLTE